MKYADSAVDFQPHVDLASRILIPPSSHYADIDYTAKNSNYISRHPPLMLKSCWKAELVRLGAVASDLCNAWDEDDIDMPTAVKVRRVIKARPKPVPIVKVDTAKVVPSTQPQPQVSVDVHPQMYASQPVVGRFGTTEKPKKKRKSGF